MKNETKLLRELPIDIVDNPSDRDTWVRSPLSTLSDAHLIAVCVATITPPKLAKPSSFVLHAPLELLARAALLPYVAPAARALARRRIAEVAVRYTHAGAEWEEPNTNANYNYSDENIAIATLLGALREGAADTTNSAAAADAALLWLLPRLPLAQLRAVLIDEITPLLGAAGHAPILLAALPRFADRIAGVGGLLRAPLRRLAAAATAAATTNTRLTWHETIGKTSTSAPSLTSINSEQALVECLIAPSRVNVSSTSIAPTLLAVESSGDAVRLLTAPVNAISIPHAEKILLRAAALSMLQDDPAHAPYGWTHCLTLPQALLQNADVSKNHRALIAVAATHVLAYRATLGRTKIDFNFVAARTSYINIVEADANTAASIAFHADTQAQPALKTQLATHAALHHDAHLAKYTLACFDAAARDPDAAPLFYAAAAFLGGWWRDRDGDDGK